MSIFDWLGQFIFRRKMKKMRSTREEMDGNVFIFRQIWHFSFVNIVIKVLFPICTLTWCVNNCVSRHGKGKSGRSENTRVLLFVALENTLFFLRQLCLTEASLLSIVAPKVFILGPKKCFSVHRCQLFSVATLRNKRRIAAFMRENCEKIARNNLAQYSSVTK